MARTEGQWKKGIGLISPSEDVPILFVNNYLNFGVSVGSSGYGMRDNAGTLQFKNFGGSWTNFGAGGGAGGGVVEETPSGSVNSSNVTFTVTVIPKWIIADNNYYIEGFGYSISGLTVTMELAPNNFIRSYS